MGVTLTTRAIAGQKIVNVRDFGARGNGVADDTDGINSAIRALGTAGGTCEIPEGKYRCDAVRGILMASRVHLKIETGAELIVIPNNAPRYGLIQCRNISDFVISGGLFTGDKDRHDYTPGSTHEWGHACQFYGAKKGTILGVQMHNFTGDGISCGREKTVRCADLEIVECFIERNRRQGISVVAADDVLIYRTTCQWIGDVDGTEPMCGIDIEPEKAAGPCSRIRILDCHLNYNKRYGLLLERRTDEDGGNDIFDVEISGTEIMENFSNGMEIKGATRTLFHDNEVHDNSASGSVWNRDINSKCYNNKFGRNYTRNGVKTQNPPFTLTGTNAKTARDILKKNNTNVDVGSNYFY